MRLSSSGNNENILNLIHLMSKYSPCLASYVTELKMLTKKPEVNFMSKLRQNQLISSIAFNIKCTIKNDLQTATFFSISIDSTFYYSRKEQI